MNEIFKPCRHVHVIIPHGLDRLIIGRAIFVVILRRGKEPFEVIAGLLEDKCRKKPGRPAVVVNKRMNMHKMKSSYTGHKDRRNIIGLVNAFYKLPRKMWNI